MYSTRIYEVFILDVKMLVITVTCFGLEKIACYTCFTKYFVAHILLNHGSKATRLVRPLYLAARFSLAPI